MQDWRYPNDSTKGITSKSKHQAWTVTYSDTPRVAEPRLLISAAFKKLKVINGVDFWTVRVPNGCSILVRRVYGRNMADGRPRRVSRPFRIVAAHPGEPQKVLGVPQKGFEILSAHGWLSYDRALAALASELGLHIACSLGDEPFKYVHLRSDGIVSGTADEMFKIADDLRRIYIKITGNTLVPFRVSDKQFKYVTARDLDRVHGLEQDVTTTVCTYFKYGVHVGPRRAIEFGTPDDANEGENGGAANPAVESGSEDDDSGDDDDVVPERNDRGRTSRPPTRAVTVAKPTAAANRRLGGLFGSGKSSVKRKRNDASDDDEIATSKEKVKKFIFGKKRGGGGGGRRGGAV